LPEILKSTKLGSISVRLFGALPVETGTGLSFPVMLLTKRNSFRLLPRTGLEGCGSRLGGMDCTALWMGFGHPTVGVRIFQLQAWCVSLPIVWGVSGLASRTTSLPSWMVTKFRYSVATTVSE